MKIAQGNVAEYSYDRQAKSVLAKTHDGQTFEIDKVVVKYMASLLSDTAFLQGKRQVKFQNIQGCQSCSRPMKSSI